MDSLLVLISDDKEVIAPPRQSTMKRRVRSLLESDSEDELIASSSAPVKRLKIVIPKKKAKIHVHKVEIVRPPRAATGSEEPRKMPRKYMKKKTDQRYLQEDLLLAVNDVRNKNCTYSQASHQYNVPVAVIYYRIKGRNIPDKKMGGGRSTVFTTEEQMVECLKARARMGYPCDKEELRDLVAKYVKENNLPTPFKDGRPGLDWYYGFMKRHKQLSFKKPEQLQKARKDQRKPDVIYNFYENLAKVVLENSIDNPALVFNADESGFGNDPSGIKAIGERGKPLSRVSGGPGRESASVLACVAADGSVLPPFIIFKGGAVQARWTSPKAYPGTVYSVSTNGWMEEPQFFNWFESVFVKWVKDIRLQKKLQDKEALLLYDGHKSHISLRIVECALSNKIILVKFPSHLTDMLQPLDKCIFGPVKTAREKKLIAYGKKHMGNGVGRLKKNEFTEILGEVWKEAITVNNINSAFINTGMFPVDSAKFPEDEFNPIDLKRYRENQRKAVLNSENKQDGKATTTVINAISSYIRHFNSRSYYASLKYYCCFLQARYGEVLTSVEVMERLKEAERLKEEKNNRKRKPRGGKTSRVKLKDSESEEENDNLRLCNDSDEDMNEIQWAEEVAADSYPEVEY
ncbi:hypothetical protein CBL_20387 [Carabus blaptoides fortunei]